MVFGFNKQPAAPVAQHTTQQIGSGMDFSRVTTREIADHGVERGFLERFMLMGEAFGGPDEDINKLYGPVGVAAAKAALDDELTAALLAGQQVGFSSDIKYDEGSSIVPRSITFDLGPLGTRMFLFW